MYLAKYLQKRKKFFTKSLHLFKTIEKENTKIFVSTIILKELYYKCKNFHLLKKFFQSCNSIEIIKTTKEDYKLARQYEKENDYKISFYDYLHIAICKRLNLI